MLLRRVIEHVKAQNWTAVAIDFLIVVVGVFIGIQVSNWNDARAERVQESAILAQLHDEFSEIHEALTKQVSIRQGYVEDLERLVAALENTGPVPEESDIKRALVAARSTGRRPAESSAYLQLTANGDLARLTNEALKNALVRYHALLDRDAFIFPELMQMVVREMSENAAIDTDISVDGPTGAAIDEKEYQEDLRTKGIRAYDFEALRAYERQYETLHALHRNLLSSDQMQLELINEILSEIAIGAS